MLAIYMLFWAVSAFFVMPFGVKTHDEDENAERVPGQVTSAPVNFRPGRVVLRATILSAVAYALFMLNLKYGWVTIDDLSLVHPPASVSARPY